MQPRLHPDIEAIRLSEAEIAARITALGDEIQRDYDGKDLVLVGVLRGATLFLADLIRRIEIPVAFDFVAVGSYGPDAKASGVVRILKDLDEPVEGKHVVVVEDVLNPTMSRRVAYLLDNLRSRRVASLKLCTLLDKPTRRHALGDTLEPDYCGFVVEEEYVVGYGLDYEGRYRSLPYIGVLKPVIYGGG